MWPRWAWLLLVLVVVRPASITGSASSDRARPPRTHRPNILILIGDDHGGGTLGIDGDPRRATPRLDLLAREGARFDRTYCNSPLCTPSRQSLITGRLPHAVGVTQLTTPLPESALTLGSWLADRGYATGAIGKMHFNGGSNHGFNERVDTPDWLREIANLPPQTGFRERPWRPLQDPASVWLNAACQPMDLPAAAMEGTFFAERAGEFFSRHREEAFALVVGFHEPHSPFRFPRELAGRYKPEDFSVPPCTALDRREQPLVFAGLTPAHVRGIAAAYYSSLAFLDQSVGRVLDALEANGLAERTIVVYVGDNGYMLGQHGRFEKHVLYEPAVRVPLIVRWPGRIEGGRHFTSLVELVDVFPTLMELCGLPCPADLHGRSLVPLLEGRPGATGRDVVFSEYLENEEAMVRSSRYKLIVGTGRRHRQDGYASANPLPGPYERLYDLETDPAETADLRAHGELAEVAADLRKRLCERVTTTRNGREPVPPGLSEIEAIRWCLVPRDVPRM
jgi:choline-sulfatase